MDRLPHLRFPAVLRAYRLAADVQQRQLAEAVGMGSAGLCAIEKGRRPVPDNDRVVALGAALSLGKPELVTLIRWAEHDRLVGYLAREGQEEAIPLLSLALQCAWHLDRRKQMVIGAELKRHIDAVTHVAALNGAADALEEGAM